MDTLQELWVKLKMIREHIKGVNPMCHLLPIKARKCRHLPSYPKYHRTQNKEHQKHPTSGNPHPLTLIYVEGNRSWYLHHPQFQNWNLRCLMRLGNYTSLKFHHPHKVFQYHHHCHRIIWMVIFLWLKRAHQKFQWMFVIHLQWIQQLWGKINN